MQEKKNSTQISSQTQDALKRFQLENQVKIDDRIYQFDEEQYDKLLDEKFWKKDERHFKHVKISALAMIKILNHAKRGDPIQVMGLMTGKVDKGVFYVLDSYALPVEGTETRVNAGNDAVEYMVNYRDQSETIGKKQNIVGWYHSHPGYGCWLSGIDVQTQRMQQQVQDPYLAIVVDPQRSMSAGKVDLGCFRTFKQGSTEIKKNKQSHKGPSVPLEKIQQFGLHADEYYVLTHQFFKSSLDSELLKAMWREYWIQTLATSPFSNNKTYFKNSIIDLSQKIQKEGSKHSDDIQNACGKLASELQQAYLKESIKLELVPHGRVDS